ncbi:hypothetical protein Goarm_022495 [Gossypium armourianum]|uniref:DUF4283 domain-containing protein n=1 Tax=Gossypium armourianum TaxID=34283 RepID=A0A7J9KG91_9ROSI|nr:hypothetical protein [Gossypium armourianum]
MNRVLEGLPWFFNNHLLLLHKLQMKEDSLTIPLNYDVFWIQIHDLPPGLMLETMAKCFGDAALRATISGGPVKIIRWLRQLDGMDLRYAKKEKESTLCSYKDSTHNLGGNTNQRNPIINEVILPECTRGCNDGIGPSGGTVMFAGLMDFGSDGENNPIHSDNGKKRQRTI